MLERHAHPHLAAGEQIAAGVDDVLGVLPAQRGCRSPGRSGSPCRRLRRRAARASRLSRYSPSQAIASSQAGTPRAGCGTQAVARVVAERIERTADERVNLAAGRLVELPVELEERCRVVGKPVAARLPGDPDDQESSRKRDQSRSNRSMRSATAPRGSVSGSRVSIRQGTPIAFEGPGVRERVFDQGSTASVLIWLEGVVEGHRGQGRTGDPRDRDGVDVRRR